MELQSTIGLYSDRAHYLQQANLIIWEELPMANKAAIECVDRLLKLLLRNQSPFGGKIFLGLRDFRQVAPVIQGGGPSACFDASIQSSALWPQFTLLRLHRPIRNSSDPEYSLWVDQVGEGTLGSEDIQLPFIDQLASFDAIIAFLFPSEILLNPQEVCKKSFLSPLNWLVDEFNSLMLNQIPFNEGMSYSKYAIEKIRGPFTNSIISGSSYIF